MTIDVGDRTAAMKRALALLGNLCGDFMGLRFAEADLLPASPLRTTLAELKAAGLVRLAVQPGSSPNPFELTLDGWYEAQKASGRFDSDEFHQRRGRVCAAMKKATAGRNQRVIIDWRKLAAESNVPVGWLLIIFKAQVLYRLDSKGRYEVRFEPPDVWIEPTFGQEPADLS